MLQDARVFSFPIFLFLFWILLTPMVLSGQEISDDTSLIAEEEEGKITPEASAYLLDLQAGDVGVDLMWDGYWRMSFISGGTFGKVNENTVFPGLNRGTAFLQEPDVTLTLWINDRWFVETTFLEGFERNTYRAGYMGQADEFVQEVVVGNAGVNATSYAGLTVPAPRYNTPGIVAKFATPRSDHELLVRYDPTETEQKVFQGQYEVKTEDIGLPDFIEGKYFLLPDEEVSNVVVYLEDRLGSISGTDGLGTTRNYRIAEPAEFFVDNGTGLVVLNFPHDGQVVAYYDVSGKPVGDISLGRNFVVPANANFQPDFEAWDNDSANLLPFDFDELTATPAKDPYDPDSRNFYETSKVTIGGNDSLILYDPGRFTPFERQNVYRSSQPLPEETWRILPLLRDRGSLYPGTAPEFGFIPDVEDKTITVFGTVGSEIVDPGFRNPANRYPFAAADPEVYGPGRETDPDKVSREIVLAIRESNPGYFLGTGVVPGSVIVRINGVRDKTVKISDDGSMTFTQFIYLDDWIEVTYRTEVLDLDGGDLFIYQGNQFRITPRLTWEIAESVRWNLSQDRTVSEYNQSPGEIKVATTLDWETDMAGLRFTGDATLTTPDTAGNLRLFGMEEGGLGLVFLTSTLVSALDSVEILSPVETLALEDRQDADKYNYITTDALGREILNDYYWSGAESTGDDGPALAARASGDPTDGRVMDLRFDAPAGDWTAGDFLADSLGPIDISGYTAMEFPIRFLNDYGSSGLGASPPTIILQIGEIGETEDHHEDGAVNAADPGSMIELDLSSAEWSGTGLTTAWTSGDWQTARFTLTSSERARLSSVRAFRVIIKDIVTPVSGRVVMGAPSFEGSPFRTEIREDDDTLATEQDVAGDEITDNSLKTAFPEVGELFHPGGETNQAMRVRWGTSVPSGADITNRWEAVSWFSGIPLESYRTMVFYVRDDAGIGDMTARATDDSNLGITVSWTSAGGGWDRITVNIADGTAVSANGNTINSISVDSSAGELTRFVLAGADENNDATGSVQSGTIYLDEIYFTDPAFALTGGAELQGHWRFEDDIASIGNFPVLGDISLNGRTEVAGGTVLSGLDRGNSAVTGYISGGADILGIKLQTDWRATWGLGNTNWSGSHALRIPARSNTFWFGDIYTRGELGDNSTFSRQNDLNLNIGPGSVRVFATALNEGDSLIQAWGGESSWGGEKWNTGVEIRYVLNTPGESGDTGNYLESWIKDYALMVPVDGEASNREAHHTFDSGVSWGPVSLDWDPELRMKSGSAPVWNQENRWAGTLSMPLRFATWSLTPSYRRDLRQVINTSSGSNNSYGDVWDTLVDGMSGQLPLFTYVPFRELFSSSDGDTFARVTEGIEEAEYETEFAIDLSRPSGSRIMDLAVPSTGDFSMERRYKRKGDTVGWENIWRGSLGFSAINMFGRFGQYPIFPIYNTEELASLIQITLADYNGTPAPGPEEILWQVNWAFTGVRNRRLVLDHRLAWNWDPERKDTIQEARLEYQWQTASKDALRLPLIKRAIPRQHHLENKERLIVTGLYPWQDAPEDAILDLGFTLYHESSWVFQDSGHLKGWFALGLGTRDGYFTNGWELGLELEISF